MSIRETDGRLVLFKEEFFKRIFFNLFYVSY